MVFRSLFIDGLPLTNPKLNAFYVDYIFNKCSEVWLSGLTLCRDDKMVMNARRRTTNSGNLETLTFDHKNVFTHANSIGKFQLPKHLVFDSNFTDSVYLNARDFTLLAVKTIIVKTKT